MNFNKHNLIASISRAVNEAGEPRHVFNATSEVIGDYSRLQNESVALMLYQAHTLESNAAKFLATEFAKLKARRDLVAEAVNTARAVWGFGGSAIDLSVWSVRTTNGLVGGDIYKGVDSYTELMEVLRGDDELVKRMITWGRSLAHRDEATEAKGMVTPAMLKMLKESILAIGRAVAKKGGKGAERLVEFGDGLGFEWSVEAYNALVDDKAKLGSIIRGIKDVVLCLINSAFFLARKGEVGDYPLSGVVSGHRTAFFILRDNGEDKFSSTTRNSVRRQHESADADVGQEAYAGAEDVVIEIGKRLVNLGNNPSVSELQEAIDAHREHANSASEAHLADAAALMKTLGLPVKFMDIEYEVFDQLKDAVWSDLRARSKARKEAAAASKDLQLAILAVQTAAKMDAVNRRSFLKAMAHLPLEQAAWALKTESDASAVRAARYMEVV